MLQLKKFSPVQSATTTNAAMPWKYVALICRFKNKTNPAFTKSIQTYLCCVTENGNKFTDKEKFYAVKRGFWEDIEVIKAILDDKKQMAAFNKFSTKIVEKNYGRVDEPVVLGYFDYFYGGDKFYKIINIYDKFKIFPDEYDQKLQIIPASEQNNFYRPINLNKEKLYKYIDNRMAAYQKQSMMVFNPKDKIAQMLYNFSGIVTPDGLIIPKEKFFDATK